MSGGYFDYSQHNIQDIIDTLEQVIQDRGKYDEEWDYTMHEYSDETFEKFEEALTTLKKAHIYTQRIDWLLSGDDGEESFHERLKEEMKQ